MADQSFLIRLSGARQHLMDPDVVQAHVAWLRDLDEAGRLLLAGVLEGGEAVVVIRAEGRDEAVKIADSDPFAEAGVYGERTVLRLNHAHAGNDYLLRLAQGRLG